MKEETHHHAWVDINLPQALTVVGHAALDLCVAQCTGFAGVHGVGHFTRMHALKRKRLGGTIRVATLQFTLDFGNHLAIVRQGRVRRNLVQHGKTGLLGERTAWGRQRLTVVLHHVLLCVMNVRLMHECEILYGNVMMRARPTEHAKDLAVTTSKIATSEEHKHQTMTPQRITYEEDQAPPIG